MLCLFSSSHIIQLRLLVPINYAKSTNLTEYRGKHVGTQDQL